MAARRLRQQAFFLSKRHGTTDLSPHPTRTSDLSLDDTGRRGALAGAAYFDGEVAAIFLTLAIVLGGVGYAFSSLTVEVSAEELAWRFGPGVFRGRVARSDILSATPVENPWWWGWGVHLTPRGWLYNISGLEAVEISLRNGRTFRIGSDDSTGLARALAPGS
ncbi:MAG: hypothetical protein ACR650_06330 [Methylocystis sp.]